MRKDSGFSALRKRERRRLYMPPAWFWPGVLIAALALMFGLTRAWPQYSGLSTSSSNSDLQTWELLSARFALGLIGQSNTLQQALTELETLKANSVRLTLLLEQSLKANDDLKAYSGQMAERMQQRDEELARAYDEIARLEKKGLRLIIAVIVMTAALAALLLIIFRRR